MSVFFYITCIMILYSAMSNDDVGMALYKKYMVVNIIIILISMT